MKGLIIIFVIFFTIFTKTNATRNETLRSPAEKLEVIHYKVKENPQLNALQSENKIMISGGILGTKIAENIFYEDIILRSDMTPEDLKQSLSKLWKVNINSIYYFEDIILKRNYF